MEEYVFDVCQRVNDLMVTGQEAEARDEMIRLLSDMKQQQIPSTPLVNHLVRKLGLYPYIQMDFASLQDQIAHEVFKANVGQKEEITLHREQSMLLKKLLEGTDLAVSAPTSFGKSFIIDAFIAIKRPKNVVIIVPTIALTDETRRRLCGKFSNDYNIITTPEVGLGEKNIFIFPQERVFGYIDKIGDIDILIIDEFYKAEASSDGRSSILLKAILELSGKAKQRYFLAPNISSLESSPFTKGMEFVPVEFKTVVTEYHHDYKDFNPENREEDKKQRVLSIIRDTKTKTLIYAGSYLQTDVLLELLSGNLPDVESSILKDFSDWLSKNYGEDYPLVKAILKGVGIHNGRLHRSLSQIQVNLFEREDGINNLVSTSSIIEGVNTSAENVILWSNKNGQARLSSFAYNNIAGRGGRMFRYFVGKVYELEQPPQSEPKQLRLEMPDDVLLSLDAERHKVELTREQIIKIVAFSEEVDSYLGQGVYGRMINDPALRSFTGFDIRSTASELMENPAAFSSLPFLFSENVKDWNGPLRDCYYHLGHLDIMDWQFIRFVKILSRNWEMTIPEMLAEMRRKGVGIDINTFFEYERKVAFDLSSLLGKVNTLLKYVRKDAKDISPFIVKVTHAFLPKLVYELEEYGLPRMISRKIQNSGLIDLEQTDKSVNDILEEFHEVGYEKIMKATGMSDFEGYVLSYFYSGITSKG